MGDVVQRLERVALFLIAVTVLAIATIAVVSAATSFDAVRLLEGRTPLFAELQDYERRDNCITELEARLSIRVFDGLTALAEDDDQALAAAVSHGRALRDQLALIDTDRDPCN